MRLIFFISVYACILISLILFWAKKERFAILLSLLATLTLGIFFVDYYYPEMGQLL